MDRYWNVCYDCRWSKTINNHAKHARPVIAGFACTTNPSVLRIDGFEDWWTCICAKQNVPLAKLVSIPQTKTTII